MASPPPLPARNTPPPLPKRDTPQLPPPPPYSAVDEARGSPVSPRQAHLLEPSILSSKDPRASSSQSLVPSTSDSDARRTLLLVYIHGFYGTDQSFRSFPAHVHDFLRDALSESHVVHSKIYPRYKTYRSIEVARDNFSAWLEPHESPTTDVILVGHSMGGLLAAEIVLMPSQTSSSRRPLKHRILGSLSLDSPFLGLHPGIVASGISSLFHHAPATPPPNQDAASPSPPQSHSPDPRPASPTTSTLSNSMLSGSTDPNFDPPFFNDTPFREQPFLTRMIHFSSKHWSEGIFTAMGNHIAHHLDFGGSLADYHGLLSRYNQLRDLEDVDDLLALRGASYSGSHARVRFVNYYTLSSGRPKLPTTAKGSRDTSQVDLLADPVSGDQLEDQLNAVVLKDSIDEKSQIRPNPVNDGELNGVAKTMDDAASIAESEESMQSADMNRQSMQHLDPIPMDEAEHNPVEQGIETAAPDTPARQSPPTEDAVDEEKPPPELDLPPIPDPPEPPKQPDLSQYTDKDARKQAEKEFGRLQKAYESAVKDRTKALREREKLLEKRQKRAQKEADRQEKDLRKQQHKSDKEEEKAAKADKKRQDKEAAAAAAAATKATTTTAAAAAAAVAPPSSSSTTSFGATPETESETPGRNSTSSKPKKLRKFCNTPSATKGVPDPAWVSVYMDGMDEVAAHCGLFFPGPHYDRLVGDVGGRIVGWVQNDLSVRAMMAMTDDKM